MYFYERWSWQKISIHAPAKGATHVKIALMRNNDISIHAPAKGATIRINPVCKSDNISIHAPAKGATRCVYACLQIVIYFNSRSREGSDDL